MAKHHGLGGFWFSASLSMVCASTIKQSLIGSRKAIVINGHKEEETLSWFNTITPESEGTSDSGELLWSWRISRGNTKGNDYIWCKWLRRGKVLTFLQDHCTP